jgi:hypothetical protein
LATAVRVPYRRLEASSGTLHWRLLHGAPRPSGRPTPPWTSARSEKDNDLPAFVPEGSATQRRGRGDTPLPMGRLFFLLSGGLRRGGRCRGRAAPRRPVLPPRSVILPAPRWSTRGPGAAPISPTTAPPLSQPQPRSPTPSQRAAPEVSGKGGGPVRLRIAT